MISKVFQKPVLVIGVIGQLIRSKMTSLVFSVHLNHLNGWEALVDQITVFLKPGEK